MPPLDVLRRDRRVRGTFLALVLLVAVPVTAISILATRIVQNEQRGARMRFLELIEAQLEDTRIGLDRQVLEFGQDLGQKIAAERRSPDALRTLRRTLPLARELFVLGSDGGIQFPPRDRASPEESAFLQRTDAIWKNAATLYEPPREELAARGSLSGRRSSRTRKSLDSRSRPQNQGRTTRGRGDSLLALARRRSEGWLSWYWQDGLHLLFWRGTPSGEVVGAEVDRIVLLSRLIAGLSEVSSAAARGRIQLVDARGDVLHAWGLYSPPPGARPDATEPLAYPLDTWRLQYFANPEAFPKVLGGALQLAAGLGVTAVALTLVLVAVWLFRSSTRSLREARQRVSFVTQVSHELKTPLANIRLYAELLENDLEDLLEDPGPERRLSVIVSESERLSRLIGNILTLTKSERGQSPKPRRPVLVDAVVERAIERFRPALEARRFDIHLHLAADRPAMADVDGLEQVLANLISNVEKYAAEGRWIRLRSDQDSCETRIRVEDRGPGIPKRQTQRIFEPFQRLSDRLDEGVSGTGIGLTIARTLVESWNGRLECCEATLPQDSEAETGATFIIRLHTASEETAL